MELTPNKWQFCHTMKCPNLDGSACKLDACIYPDPNKALKDRRKQLMEEAKK